MRKLFVSELYKQMKNNKNIWLLTGDVGFGVLDDIKRDFPDRFINCGASESAMMDIGIGLAMSGKIPFVYTITPFLVFRAFESIRNYVNREKCPVKLVAIGRNRDYGKDGFSHWADDVNDFLVNFKNIKFLTPIGEEQVKATVNIAITNGEPTYISLSR